MKLIRFVVYWLRALENDRPIVIAIASKDGKEENSKNQDHDS